MYTSCCNSEHFTVCVHAYREGHFDATKLLLDHGVECNSPSGSNDDTPLTLACWKGHNDIVNLLIEHGSNLNHQTKTGCTPLMEATRYVCINVRTYIVPLCMCMHIYICMFVCVFVCVCVFVRTYVCVCVCVCLCVYTTKYSLS